MRVATRYVGGMASSLLHDIETFLLSTEIAESAFGRGAVNDWKFVRDLRSGRRIWPETEAKVRRFMLTYTPEQQAEAA